MYTTQHNSLIPLKIYAYVQSTSSRCMYSYFLRVLLLWLLDHSQGANGSHSTNTPFLFRFVLSELHILKRGESYPTHHTIMTSKNDCKRLLVSKLAVLLVKLLNFVLSRRVHSCRMNKIFIFTSGYED